MSQKLADLLVKERAVSPEQIAQALKTQATTPGSKLGSVLVQMGVLTDDSLTRFLAKQYNVMPLEPEFKVEPDVLRLISAESARRHQVLPISRNGTWLRVAMADPSNVFAMDELKFMTGCNVDPVVASENIIMAAIEKAYTAGPSDELTLAGADGVLADANNGNGEADNLEAVMADLEAEEAADVEVQEEEDELNVVGLEAAAGQAPVVRLVNVILTEAVKRKASDIHMEPYETEYRVRFRVDGALQTIMKPPRKMKDAIISRIKIMARLDISEKRLPQDGRIMLKMMIEGKKKQLDYRVSSLPTLWGEKIVLRLLDKENLRLDMTQLGFEPESLERFTRAIFKPYGMVLVTGPTGSGKTNTLYSAISQLNKPDTNIMTAEDPVEFQLAGVNQVQMKDQIGLNFAAALRSFLRQDPNIILVGEIRDFETAEIAIKAALTGHLVLSTLHTNGAPETISRLMNMGIEPFLVATSVHLIVAQRLIRRICNGCSEKQDLPPKALLDAGYTPAEVKAGVKVMKGRGCAKCNGKGYKGRTALYEVMEIDDELRELILVGASAVELKKKAVERGMITLRRSGLIKVAQGITTLEEVARETVHG
ncbi:MAG TPA: type IV-A pilus assembly ATPase PilB [candidate division Zixibacteria bacterium]|nr:type IV-A pilus assembly ATPase PilB [candidate division Zixibacteria bacterium]